MHVTFYGATREVTGSMHLLGTGTDYILMDCGMFQGRRKEAAEKNRVMPFDPAMVTNMVLSHAHIDHSGRIPLLSRKGFSGRIFCTRALASARQDPTPQPGFDQDDYVSTADADRRPLADLLEELDAVRAATRALFRSFDDEGSQRAVPADGEDVLSRPGRLVATHAG